MLEPVRVVALGKVGPVVRAARLLAGERAGHHGLGQVHQRSELQRGDEIGVEDPAAIVQPDARGARFYGLHGDRSEEHTSELQSLAYLVCRLLLEKKKRASNPTNSGSSSRYVARSFVNNVIIYMF